LHQLIEAAVDIADDVEGAVLVPKVVPQRLARDRDYGDLLGRSQFEYMAKALTIEAADRASQLCGLIPHDVRSELPVRARLVSLVAQLLGHIENNGNREHVKLAGQLDQGFA
jgi:hypothetical protein